MTRHAISIVREMHQQRFFHPQIQYITVYRHLSMNNSQKWIKKKIKLFTISKTIEFYLYDLDSFQLIPQTQ